jgi:hypothetical protein
MRSLAGGRLPSPAFVLALIALIAGLGGAAYAVTLKKNQVKTRNIAPGAVTGNRIDAGAVKPQKLRDGAVIASKLAGGAVTTAAIADNAVNRTQIANDAINRQKIAAQAVGTPKIANGAVENAKLADGAVSAAKLAPQSVTSASVLLAFTSAQDGGALAAGECARLPIVAAGVQPGDSVVVTPPATFPAEVVVSADTAANEVGLRLCALSAIDPPVADFRFLVID